MIQSVIDSVVQFLHGLWESKLFVCGVVLVLVGGAVRRFSRKQKSKIPIGPDGRHNQDGMLEVQKQTDTRDHGTILVVLGVILLAFKFNVHHLVISVFIAVT